MIGKELEMEADRYAIVTDRICLLSNNLPPYELHEDSNDINAGLFLSNLALKRKNKMLNRCNNKIHEKIKTLIASSEREDVPNCKPMHSRNSIDKDCGVNVISQTLEIFSQDALQPTDNEVDQLNKSKDLDRKSDFQTEHIDSRSTSRNLGECDKDSEEWEELSNKDLAHSRKMSPENIDPLNSNLNAKSNVNFGSTGRHNGK